MKAYFYHSHKLVLITGLLFLLWCAATTVAQNTGPATSFTYQGRLTDSGNPANGNYDLQFALFDSLTGGSQIGSTQSISNVAVSGGVFTVELDFGASAFPGADRFLEISVRSSAGATFITLTPRQQISSTPYAIRALSASNADGAATATTATNATQLGGLAASQYVQTNDARLSDARTPTAGSANYIQNTNGGQTANFNISGNGKVGGTLSGNIVNAATQYNLAGNRILSAAGTGNLFAGIGAGQANTTGFSNSFFGAGTGVSNTTGGGNSFFGTGVGSSNTTGFNNSFVGADAGASNTTGQDNAFFGAFAGISNSEGINNAFFGRSAGQRNTKGGDNTFIGIVAGQNNTIGGENTFIGAGAGFSNTTESFNNFFGVNSDGVAGITNATAIGARAKITQSNSIVLGSINGVNGATADVNVGIGTTAPGQRLHVVGNGLFTGNLTVTGTFNGNVAASSITGVLPSINGGTGLSATGANGNFLRSNGSVWTSGPLLSSDVPVGSANYIQNGTAQQSSSNFNISGNGTAGGTLSANVINGATQYNIGGARVLSISGFANTFVGQGAGLSATTLGAAGPGGQNAFFGTDAGRYTTDGFANSFFGEGAGTNNTTGFRNAFFGTETGLSNTTGIRNSFFGSGAGSSNTIGTENSFFGFGAGYSNTTGHDNSFFGPAAGASHTEGQSNSFFGTEAGRNTTVAYFNSFFGARSGLNNTTGRSNAFFGTGAGISNTTEDNNSFFGASSDGAAGVTNATAIGANAKVTQSNSLILGSINGVNGATADVNVGIGTTAPNAKLQVTSGDVYVQTQGKGIILRATDGANCYRVTVNNAGALTAALVTCP